SHLADVPYVVDHVYRVGFPEEYQERMARGYFENVAFRLPSQAIIISVAPYEARAAGLCESYAKFYPWNRTHHSFIEIFNGLYETSVSEYGAGALVFFDRYTFKFQFHTVALPRLRAHCAATLAAVRQCLDHTVRGSINS